jgi:hypothetical protein
LGDEQENILKFLLVILSSFFRNTNLGYSLKCLIILSETPIHGLKIMKITSLCSHQPPAVEIIVIGVHTV